MPTLSQIIHSNNRAVELFREGRCLDAASLFYSSIGLVAIALAPSRDDSHQHDCGPLLDPTSGVHIVPHAGSSVFPDDSNFLFYHRAFSIHGDDSEIRRRDWQTHMCALLTFNMGLVQHAHALQHGKTSDLAKVLQLYQSAYDILNYGTPSLPESGEMLILFLAIVNNMGNIYSHLFDEQGAQRSHDVLRCVLAHIEQMGDSTIDQAALSFFHVNVLLSSGANVVAKLAPAA